MADRCWQLIWEHVKLTFVSAVLVVLVAVPLGIALTRGRLRAAAPLVVGIANAGQAAPSIGLIVLLAMWLDFGFWTAVLALTLYGVLPVLRNTITGLQGVDRDAGGGRPRRRHVRARRAAAHRAAARRPGDHGRRAHRPGAAGRHRHPRHVHQRRRPRRDPPDRHLAASGSR